MSPKLVLYPEAARLLELLLFAAMSFLGSGIGVLSATPLTWMVVLFGALLAGYFSSHVTEQLTLRVIAPLAARWKTISFRHYQSVLDRGPSAEALTARIDELAPRTTERETLRALLRLAQATRHAMALLDGRLDAGDVVRRIHIEALTTSRHRLLDLLRERTTDEILEDAAKVRAVLEDLRWYAVRLAAYEAALRTRSASTLFSSAQPRA